MITTQEQAKQAVLAKFPNAPAGHVTKFTETINNTSVTCYVVHNRQNDILGWIVRGDTNEALTAVEFWRRYGEEAE